MRKPGDTELRAAELLLDNLENYYDVSEEDLDPITPGHLVHAAVGNWRRSLPRNKLSPEFSRLRDRLWKLSKVDRGEAKDVATDFADLLRHRYPSLADEEHEESPIAKGKWFDSPPPPASSFKHGPLSGQLQQLVSWIASGDSRTLQKHNGHGSCHIMKEHGRRFNVWFRSSTKFEEVRQRQRSENA